MEVRFRISIFSFLYEINTCKIRVKKIQKKYSITEQKTIEKKKKRE